MAVNKGDKCPCQCGSSIPTWSQSCGNQRTAIVFTGSAQDGASEKQPTKDTEKQLLGHRSAGGRGGISKARGTTYKGCRERIQTRSMRNRDVDARIFSGRPHVSWRREGQLCPASYVLKTRTHTARTGYARVTGVAPALSNSLSLRQTQHHPLDL